MSTVIKVENLSKYYRLGLIGGGTLREDVNRWIAKARGKPDPLLKVGETDHGNRKDGQIWALRDVNFEVQEGEILGIIGRNGAGKSTLLKILSRITAPTEGRIKIKGRVGSLLEVGTGFHPELTGRENIYLNGTILGMSKAEVSSKLDEIVEFAEMSKFIDTPVKRYSSGMTVRLAFAVAAHLEPEILIVDEVLAVGDAAFQKKCLGKMKDVASHGRTVLFVSHNMNAISRLTSRCVLLKHGQNVSDSSPDEIISEYLSDNKALAADVLDNLSKLPCEGIIEWKELALLNNRNKESDYFSAGESIRVRMKFELVDYIRGLKIGFYVRNADGEILFYSFHNDIIETLDESMENKDISYIAEIHPGIFNSGNYHLGLCATIHGQRWLCRDHDLVDFSVELSVFNKILQGPRPGLIAPMIKWQ